MTFRYFRMAVAVLSLIAICALFPIAASAAPVNDNLANATELTGPASSVYGDTRGASSEPNEPCYWGCGPSVWYKWTPAYSGTYGVGFDTCYSGFDTTLAVFTGSTMSSLQPVTANDDGCWLSSAVWLNATAGTTYLIRVGGWNGGAGSFVLNYPAGRTSNTPPSVTVTGVADHATYEHGQTPVAGCSVVDAEDGNSSPTAALSAFSGPRAAAGLGSQTATCSYTDAGGATRTATATYVVQDTIAPAVTVPTDQTVEATSPSGATAEFAASAADGVDGVTDTTCDPSSGSTFALGATTVTCTSTDTAGNLGSGSFVVSVVDTTAPSLTLPQPISATATSTAGATVSYATTATDIVDGASTVSCSTASGATFAPGTTTVTCSTTDAAGNTATGSFTVQVTFAWSNVLAPINADGSSLFKLGSTVPVKFRLTGDSSAIGNLVSRVYVTKLTNSVSGSELEAISTSAATEGSLFRYADGQYMFNLATKSLSAGTWRVRIDLGDAVTHTVIVSLR